LKFVLDGMLGKLTRWLRMLGQDVKYSASLDDGDLLVASKREKRTLLTRDLELYKQATAKGIEAYYLQGQTEQERLAELAKRFNLKLEIDMTASRCPKCNARVKTVPKEEIACRIEKNTFEHYDKFWECPKCKQIYWQGAHWQKIRETLAAAKISLEDQSEEHRSVLGNLNSCMDQKMNKRDDN